MGPHDGAGEAGEAGEGGLARPPGSSAVRINRCPMLILLTNHVRPTARSSRKFYGCSEIANCREEEV